MSNQKINEVIAEVHLTELTEDRLIAILTTLNEAIDSGFYYVERQFFMQMFGDADGGTTAMCLAILMALGEIKCYRIEGASRAGRHVYCLAEDGIISVERIHESLILSA